MRTPEHIKAMRVIRFYFFLFMALGWWAAIMYTFPPAFDFTVQLVKFIADFAEAFYTLIRSWL